MQTEKYVKVSEVAERLSVTEEYVRRLLRTGRLRGYKLGSGQFDEWRIAVSDIRTVLRSV